MPDVYQLKQKQCNVTMLRSAGIYLQGIFHKKEEGLPSSLQEDLDLLPWGI